MKKVKILVIEDESIVAMDIEGTLRQLNFEVIDTVTNYEDAIKSVYEHKPDILLTDINLKNSKNGIETARDIQKIAPIPIIYLTAFSDEKTLQEAFETNPINYITKPFTREDLKIKILLALHKIQKNKTYRVPENCKNLGNDFYFNEKDQLLYQYDMNIKLSPKEKNLLSILVAANNQIVTQERLEYYLWPDDAPSGSSLRTLIYRLRGKLDYDLIETIPASGFKLTIIS